MRGVSEARLPLLIPAEEVYYTAAAWADAIDNARRAFPTAFDRLLWERDLDSPMAKDALAALLLPPEELEIEAFSENSLQALLDVPENIQSRAIMFLNTPENFLLAICAWADLQTQLQMMRGAWPKSLAELWTQAPILEEAADQLEDLLGLFVLLARANTDFMTLWESWDSIAGNRNSVLPALLTSGKSLAQARPSAALAEAEQALSLADRLARQYPEDMGKAGKLVSAIGRIRRAEALIRLGQNALATIDLEEADRLLGDLPAKPAWRARVYALLGELARLREKWPEMCSSFKQACAFGDCQPLTAAGQQCDHGY